MLYSNSYRCVTSKYHQTNLFTKSCSNNNFGWHVDNSVLSLGLVAFNKITLFANQNSVVDRATTLWARRQRNRGSVPCRGKGLLCSGNYPNGNREIFHGIKKGQGVKLTTSNEVKNECNYTSSPHTYFHGTRRDDFPLPVIFAILVLIHLTET